MSKREVLAKAKVLSIKQSNRKSWRGAINIIKDSSSTVPGWSGKDDHFLEKDIRHHVVPAKGLPEDFLEQNQYPGLCRLATSIGTRPRTIAWPVFVVFKCDECVIHHNRGA